MTNNSPALQYGKAFAVAEAIKGLAKDVHPDLSQDELDRRVAFALQHLFYGQKASDGEALASCYALAAVNSLQEPAK